MGDRVGNGKTLGAIAALLYLHGDELGRTFPVSHDGVGKLKGNTADRFSQRQEIRRACIDGRAAQRPCRNEHTRIVGRRIAVDGNAVEACLHRVSRHRAQRIRSDRGIGGDERQHRSHVRANHPRALGDPGDDRGPTTEIDGSRCALGNDVGGRDGGRGIEPAILVQPPGHDGDRVLEPLDRQRLADDTGRERQDTLDRHPRSLGNNRATLFRVSDPARPGPRVRIPRVDEQIARRRPGEVLACNRHRRGTKRIAGECRRA